MNRRPFQPGITTLITRHKTWLARGKIALVTHPAAMDRRGAASTDLLKQATGSRLKALFGPEHGFLGAADAGSSVRHSRHPQWGIPVFSLYGRHRKPTTRMLRDLDTIVFDLQDLGARPYTYVSTLRYVLEAAADHELTVIVADRPVPLPRTADGPLLDPAFRSFVANIPAPMAYGMTPGETALWLKHRLGLDLRLQVARMSGYNCEAGRQPGWPPWIPPSPGIKSWESAQCYLATVFCEALPVIDNGRGTNLAFQLLGATWMDAGDVLRDLARRNLRGIDFHPHAYISGFGRFTGKALNGLRLTVNNPRTFRPVTTAIHILDVLGRRYGPSRIWRSTGANPSFFDKLFGTDQVRTALQAKTSARDITASWRSGLTRFKTAHKPFLLYHDSTL